MRTQSSVLRFICLGALIGILSACTRSDAQAGASIKFVSWNAEWFPGGNPDATPEEASAKMALARTALQTLNPDIFVGEEIRDWKAFSDLTSVVPGLRVDAVSAFRDADTGGLAHQQVGIASKIPVEAAWSEPWRPTIPALPRGFTFAAVEMPDSGKVILVYGLHLKSNRPNAGNGNNQEEELNSVWRDEMISQLLAHVYDMERVTFKGRIHGIIVAGDFNTNEDHQFADHVVEKLISRGFHNTWAGVPAAKRQTWRGNGYFQPTTFDYIFTKGLGKPSASLTPIPEGTSDHWPVTITVR